MGFAAKQPSLRPRDGDISLLTPPALNPNCDRCVDAISANRAIVFMLRAVPVLTAGIGFSRLLTSYGN